MGYALLMQKGIGVDSSDLSASPGDVLTGGKFYGSGTDQVQKGTILEQGAPSYVLGLNEKICLPAGYYAGGKITQNIENLSPPIVTPSDRDFTIASKGKILTEDIYVEAIPNLLRENIKEGCYVGGVGPGTWRGYVNDDIYTPYLYGTFAPGQSITSIAYHLGKAGIVTHEEKFIDIYNKGSNTTTAIMFTRPLDLTHKGRLVVEFETRGGDYPNHQVSHIKVLISSNTVTSNHLMEIYGNQWVNCTGLNILQRIDEDYKKDVSDAIAINLSRLSGTLFVWFVVDNFGRHTHLKKIQIS